MFFILFDNWNSLIFVKACLYNEILLAAILQLSSKQSVLKEVRIFRFKQKKTQKAQRDKN